MKEDPIKILTHTLFEEFFLLSEGDVDELLNRRIKNFDPIESICFSSFLNMVFQTTDQNELLNLQKTELEILLRKQIRRHHPIILYHRNNLLFFISIIISSKVHGNKKVTGKNNYENSLKYYQSLLLINNKINFLKYLNFEREIIKSFPMEFKKILFHYYKQRIMRYSFIYDYLLNEVLPSNKKDILINGISLIEKTYGIQLKDYIDTVKGLFVWFLGAKELSLNTPHFDYKKINSFYIRKENFKEKKEILNTLIALSLDIREFRTEFETLKKDIVDNEPYFYFQKFFDFPIFRFDNDNFCIIDFKFLVEGICSGLMWKMDSIIRKDDSNRYSIQNIKEQYGYLIEEYFAFLMKNIFYQSKITCEQNGMQDGILECKIGAEKYILVFEFTTKYYKISSLYNQNPKNFKNDLIRILFSKNKKDKGKFINLNKYVSHKRFAKEKVIPILLTENYIGDYDLLNKSENELDKMIDNYGLNALKESKPILLCLDDLETFWAISNNGKEAEQFINGLNKWESAEKGRYLFSFSNFISEGKTVKNKNYAKIFSINKM